MFFRGKQDGTDPTLNQKFIDRSVRPARVNQIYLAGVKDKRASTSQEVRIEVPYVESHETKPLRRLKGLLFDTIVKNRIFKEEDVQELFKYTREANSHLPHSIVEDAISTTYKELNS